MQGKMRSWKLLSQQLHSVAVYGSQSLSNQPTCDISYSTGGIAATALQQVCGYLPSPRASLCGHYRIILFGNRTASASAACSWSYWTTQWARLELVSSRSPLHCAA